jgi:hypothetical protein
MHAELNRVCNSYQFSKDLFASLYGCWLQIFSTGTPLKVGYITKQHSLPVPWHYMHALQQPGSVARRGTDLALLWCPGLSLLK